MKRAIVIITEGASRPLLEQWVAAGLLPGFASLLQSGRHGLMRSDIVPYEPPGLISAFTGASPGEHGVYSYWAAQNADIQPRVLQPGDIARPLLWNRPEFGRRRVALVNLFGTCPVEPLNGSSIAYPMQQTVHACHPRGLLLELSQAGIRIHHDVSIWYAGQARETFLSRVLEADVQRTQAAFYLWNKERPDLLVLNLTGIDRVAHFYWHELEPGSPIAPEQGAIFRAFQTADLTIRRATELLDDETSLLVFSEIGSGPLRAFCSVNAALEKAGLLRTEGQEIDWGSTAAFEAVQGTHGVNINLRGRNRAGIIEPEDYDRTRRQTRDALIAATNPYTGLPLFKAVRLREEVYAGECLPRAPDLVVEPLDERYLPLGDPFWARAVNRTLQSGWHRRDSFWAAVGTAVGAGEAEEGRPAAVYPTLCRMLGIDVDARGLW
ncbi:uncharacterized protein SOCEGT47_074560 [Sorangium cellulosum]|uniref:Phosphodiesterase n=1 Tax=Sorangium cellulosum TaxID=56 RepID=A0A4P2QC55_SORCE|nr:alkaline phosphatase family protein [Sorangium cellulosum]AUX26886.1 uncharacterized protein SOCEGT47_074560 [Sorangium cellulosum]